MRKVKVLSTKAIGYFHGFGFGCIEPNNGPAINFSIAIVEIEDGSVKECSIWDIQFLDKPKTDGGLMVDESGNVTEVRCG